MVGGAWVRLEWHIVHSTTVGSLEVKLFNSADSTTADDTISFSNLNTGAAFANIRIGASTNTANFPTTGTYMYIDDIVCGATSYPGPSGGGASAISATGLAVPVSFGSPAVQELVVGTGLAVPVAFGSPTLRPGVSTLTDDFDDNSLDGAKWFFWGDAGSTRQETTQQIVVTVDNSASSVYGGIQSQNRYSLNNSEMYMKVPTYPTASANVQVYLTHTNDSSHRAILVHQNGTWYAQYTDGGSATTHATYAGTPAWIKISCASGTLHYWWSTDGTTWTEIGTGVAVGNWTSDGLIEIGFGHYASDISSNTAKFDNFNVPGSYAISATGLAVPIVFGTPTVVSNYSTISATGLAVPVAFGSPVVTEKIVATGLAVPVAFGSAVVTEKIVATGLAIPVAFGSEIVGPKIVATGLAVPVVFGTPTLPAQGISATGLAIPIAFGLAEVKAKIVGTGLAVPVAFGSETLTRRIFATGLAVPVSFGSPTLILPGPIFRFYVRLDSNNARMVFDSALTKRVFDSSLVAKMSYDTSLRKQVMDNPVVRIQI
jgi:hypothetical protein